MEEAPDEQDREDVHHRVDVLGLAGGGRDHRVGDDAEADAVGDRVGEGHAHDGEEPLHITSLARKSVPEDDLSFYAYDNGSEVYFAEGGPKFNNGRIMKVILKSAVIHCILVASRTVCKFQLK